MYLVFDVVLNGRKMRAFYPTNKSSIFSAAPLEEILAYRFESSIITKTWRLLQSSILWFLNPNKQYLIAETSASVTLFVSLQVWSSDTM